MAADKNVTLRQRNHDGSVLSRILKQENNEDMLITHVYTYLHLSFLTIRHSILGSSRSPLNENI